ncbi:ArsR/SmtB family transcription factor [Chloroflexota bacterium]
MEELDRAAIYRLHAQFCKTLSDANRLLIIAELAKGEASVSELAQRLQLQQANMSKHLGLMRERGLVVARREGANVYYALSDPRIIQAIKLLKEVQADQIEKQYSLAQGSP